MGHTASERAYRELKECLGLGDRTIRFKVEFSAFEPAKVTETRIMDDGQTKELCRILNETTAGGK